MKMIVANSKYILQTIVGKYPIKTNVTHAFQTLPDQKVGRTAKVYLYSSNQTKTKISLSMILTVESRVSLSVPFAKHL